MKKVHLRDPQLPSTAIHFLLNLTPEQLTDDEKQVTCGQCRRMIERKERYLWSKPRKEVERGH